MVDTKYDNGVLICANHGTTISKRNGKFYCAQCNRNANTRAGVLRSGLKEENRILGPNLIK